VSDSPPPKVAPYAFPERYALPGRPAGDTPAVQDAHRQTHFLLPADLALFEQAMNLQLSLVAAGAKKRSAETAALLGFWSRVFSCLSDGCVLLGRASYASCPPLLRAACDCIAAQRSLIADGFDEYNDWLASALGKDREHAASYIEMGRFRAGSVLAQDERLGRAYRFLTDLTMPHFGGTLFQVGPDSSQQKLALAIGESAFHLGLAELVSGWLLLLAGAQTEAALDGPFVEPGHPLRDEAARLRKQTEEALAAPRRCRAEELPDGRRLIHNFRRAVSGAPRRVLL
jgi:hypothetical protein